MTAYPTRFLTSMCAYAPSRRGATGTSRCSFSTCCPHLRAVSAHIPCTRTPDASVSSSSRVCCCNLRTPPSSTSTTTRSDTRSANPPPPHEGNSFPALTLFVPPFWVLLAALRLELTVLTHGQQHCQRVHCCSRVCRCTNVLTVTENCKINVSVCCV